MKWNKTVEMYGFLFTEVVLLNSRRTNWLDIVQIRHLFCCAGSDTNLLPLLTTADILNSELYATCRFVTAVGKK